jgi:hypothetical protein
LAVVSHGYQLVFTAPPPPFKEVRVPMPREPAKTLALLEEVKALLAKDAITRLHGRVTKGPFSTFFLATKKSGE